MADFDTKPLIKKARERASYTAIEIEYIDGELEFLKRDDTGKWVKVSSEEWAKIATHWEPEE